MRLVALIITFALPLCAHAQNVGDLSPNPNNSSTSGNPFSPGGSWSISRQGSSGIGRAAPTGPYSWSNVSPIPGPSAGYDRPHSSPLRTPEIMSPNVPGRSLGPYGITLPSNHPLGLGTR